MAIVDDGPRPGIILQTWGGVTGLTFSPDGNELVASTQSGLYAFDLESGLVRARLAGGEERGVLVADGQAVYRNKLVGVEIRDRASGRRIEAELGPAARDLRRVFGRTARGELVAETYTGVGVYAGTPLAKLREQKIELWPDTALGADGSILASLEFDGTGKSQAQPLHLWRVADLKPLRTLRCAPDTPRHFAVSAGGAFVACESFGGTIITRADGSSFVVQARGAMQFHPARPLLAFASGLVVDVTRPASIITLDGGRLASDAYSYGGYTTVAWSPDGARVALAGLGGEIDVFDASGARLRSFTDRVATIASAERAAPGVVVIREHDRMRTWDAATGISQPLDSALPSGAQRGPAKPGLAVDDAWRQGHFAATADGKTRAVFRYVIARQPPVTPATVEVTRDGRPLSSIAPTVKPTDITLSSDGKQLYIVGQTWGQPAVITAHDTTTGQLAWTHSIPGEALRVRAAPNGDVAGLFRVKVPGQTDDNYEIVVVQHGKPAARYTATRRTYLTAITDLVALADGRWLLAEKRALVAWDPRSDKRAEAATPAERLALSGGSQLVATTEHALHVVDAKTLASLASIAAPDAILRHSVWLTETLIATVVDDGTLALFTWRDGKLARAGTLIALPRRGTVLVSTGGYYMAEAEAASALGFVVDGQPYRFEQLDRALARPHVALGVLGVASAATLRLYEAAYRKRGGAAVVKGALVAPALVPITPLPLRVTTDKLTVSARPDSRSAPIARVNIRVNGVPVLGRDGLAVTATTADITREVALEVGDNRIELEAETAAGMRALSRPTIVTRVGAPTPGTLHVIAIGVSKYKAGHDLQYAAKDAADIAAVMARAARAGAAVKTTVLHDDQVTRASVLALRAQLEQTALADTVVMFVAGHGLLDEHDEYVFATHDVAFATGAGGIRYTELEGLLDGIPARRRILLLDTCHAGELDADELAYIEGAQRAGKRGIRRVKLPPAPLRDVDPRARAVAARMLFTELGRGSGTTVIAASAGAEYSFEDAAIKNGLFSHALIDGLDAGTADANKDGAIRVSELLDHVREAVARQSGGFQVPQARMLNRDLDFDLTPGRARQAPGYGDPCRASTGPDGRYHYECDGIHAIAGPATPGLAANAQLDALAGALPPLVANVVIAWSPNGPTSRKLVATAPGYKPVVHTGFISVDGGRVATCIAVTPLPKAIDRCKRALPALLKPTPPDRLP